MNQFLALVALENCHFTPAAYVYGLQSFDFGTVGLSLLVPNHPMLYRRFCLPWSKLVLFASKA